MWFAAGSVIAGSFKVFPLKLELGQKTKTTLFKITNTGDTEVTVQLETAKWFQNEKGEDQYEDTSDIVYFPKIVKVEAGQQRIIRIGFRGKPSGPLEKTYRIFAQELPEKGEKNSALKFSLRFSVPIFVRIPDTRPKATFSNAELINGQLSVMVNNAGTEHFVVKSVNVNGLRFDGQQTFTAKSGGWYVLPEVTKPFSVKMPENECRKSEHLKFKVETTAGAYENIIPVNAGDCVMIGDSNNATNSLSFTD